MGTEKLTVDDVLAIQAAGIDAWDATLLMKHVIGIDVEWHDKFTNTPTIEIILSPDAPTYHQEEHLTFELPTASGSNIYFTGFPDGRTSYFFHSGDTQKNEGGYGGAEFVTKLFVPMTKQTSRTVLRGPWSSRATVTNMALEPFNIEICDVVFLTPRGRDLYPSRISGSMRLNALRMLVNHFNPDFYVIRPHLNNSAAGREGCGVTASTERDCVKKPNGMISTYYALEVHTFEIIE